MKMPCDINRADEFNMNHAVNIRSAFARYCLRTQQLACHVTLISKRLCFLFFFYHFILCFWPTIIKKLAEKDQRPPATRRPK